MKKEFGVGYQITIDKKSESNSVDDTVTDIIVNAVPEATILSNVSSELSFQLPLDSSSQFVKMFYDLDKVVERNEISTYGVSITTLEEVFIMVGRGETGNRELMASSSKEASKKDVKGFSDEFSGNAINTSAEDITSRQLFARHVQALLEKRALNFKRDRKAWVSKARLFFTEIKFCTQLINFLNHFVGLFNDFAVHICLVWLHECRIFNAF